MNRFENKRVIITGAASGIGQAAAMRMASEGAILGLLDLNKDSLIRTAQEVSKQFGTTVFTRQCDVGQFDQVGEAIDSLVKEMGGLQALSHNAGILKVYNTHEMTLEQWNQIIRVNLTGTFAVNRFALPHLLRNDQSYLVNMSSIAEHHPHPWASAYSASKGGIHSFTRSLFIEYHKQGLRANTVKPGSIQSGLADNFSIPKGGDPELINFLVPFGKPHMVGAEHAASTIAFLCSDDAYHINGTEIIVDGGKI